MAPIIWLGLILRLILLFFSNSHPDVGNHLDWGIRFWQYGPQSFYQQSVWSVSWPNQPFASIYLFALLASLRDTIYHFFWFLNNTFPMFPSKLIWILETNLHVWLVKLPFIFSDLAIALLIRKIVAQSKPQLATLAATIFFLNPVTIYNSTVWGQTDSLINLLCLVGFYLTYRKKFLPGIFLFFLSFAFKMSLLIYLPIFFILLYHYRSDFLKIVFPLGLSLLFFIFATIPFSWGQNPFIWIYRLYHDYVYLHQGNMLNGNAFNLWFIIFGADLTRQDNFPVLYTLSAKYLGYFIGILFLIPIWLKLFLSRQIQFNSLLINCLLTAFTVFIFFTNMHERYLYPIFPIITLILFIKPSFITKSDYLILSFIHLLNLYNLWFYPDIPWLKSGLIYNHFLVGKLLSFVLIFYWSKFLLDYLRRD